MSIDPLPFCLKVPARATIGFGGIESVSYRVDGLLHLEEWGIALEWGSTRTTEEVSFGRIGTDVDQLPLELLELPIERIAGAWVIGGWWWPRLELRARGLDDFEGVPGARGVILRLRIHQRDRELARAIVLEIEARAAAAQLAPESRPRLGAPDPEW